MYGKNAGLSAIELTNCVFIGINAGIDIMKGNNLVIIGDNVKSLDRSQENVVFIGNKVAIGKTVFGEPCNLYDLLTELK